MKIIAPGAAGAVRPPFAFRPTSIVSGVLARRRMSHIARAGISQRSEEAARHGVRHVIAVAGHVSEVFRAGNRLEERRPWR